MRGAHANLELDVAMDHVMHFCWSTSVHAGHVELEWYQSDHRTQYKIVRTEDERWRAASEGSALIQCQLSVPTVPSSGCLPNELGAREPSPHSAQLKVRCSELKYTSGEAAEVVLLRSIKGEY